MANNVLICDDAMFMRTVLKRILTDNGYNVVGEAENGIKAIEKAKELKPDIITLDITMPDMDGLQALRKMRKDGIKSYIIMCSAMGQQGMVLDCVKSGANDFIVKPFEQIRILDALKKINV